MTWLIDGRRLARKVKNAAELRTISSSRPSDERPCQTCPTCGSSVSHEVVAEDWPGLPAGVKFDPSDKELLEHLAAKVGSSTLKSHPFIDEFIPTLKFEDGICYAHPEKLPGIRCDGTSSHYFHRPANAYTTGTRKRRRIQNDNENALETRWHKTGKTRAVVENGIQYGYKKIMVLYTGFAKNMKPNKTCWVMHQYHIGEHEEEGDGELVVSKIFYQTQPRQTSGERKMDPLEENHEHAENFKSTNVADASKPSVGGTPLTPNMFAPSRPQKSKNAQVNHVEGPLLHENQKVKHNQLPLSEARVNHMEVPLLHENQEDKHSQLPLSEASVNHVEGSLLRENQEDKLNQLPLSETRSDQLNERIDVALEQSNVFSAEQEAPANGDGGTSNFEPFNVNSQDQAIPFDSQEMANMGLCTNDSQLAAAANAFLSSSDPADNLQCDEDIRSFPDGGLARSIENDARHLFRELGFTFDAEPCVPQKFSLEDIMLDTPPDISVVDLVGSQDSVDWLDKKVLETGISFRACAPRWAA